MAVDERPIDLVVAQAAAALAGAAGVGGEAELLDEDREAVLGELGGLVARVGDDVDGVVAVGVVAPAGAAAEHLAREERLAIGVVAVEAGVADGFLVGGHAPVDRLGDDAGEEAE